MAALSVRPLFWFALRQKSSPAGWTYFEATLRPDDIESHSPIEIHSHERNYTSDVSTCIARRPTTLSAGTRQRDESFWPGAG